MEKYDKCETYCRMLGHSVPFKYCRKVKEGAPCYKIMDCWFEKIPIEEYLNECYTDEEKKIAFTPPKPKVATLIDLIEKAKKGK